MGSASHTYTYDNLDRVLTDAGGPVTFTYTYDANGNRTSMNFETDVLELTYAGTSNRAESFNTIPISQDAAGNTTTGLLSTDSYNHANRRLDANNGVAIVAFSYDSLGRRVSKQEGNPVHYGYTPDSRYLFQFAFGASQSYFRLTEYIWLDGLPLAQVQTNYGAGNTVSSRQIHHIHADHINTPRGMTGSTAVLVWRWDHDAFGMASTDDDPDQNNSLTTLDLRFPGQIFDAEIYTHYNIFRDYDSITGRYLQSDPIGLDGGLNTYAYVNGNPITTIDPDGLSPIKLIKLCKIGYQTIRNVSFKEAVKIAKNGDGDILASSHAEARRIAKAASQAKKPIRDPAHGEDYMPHYHPKPRSGSHVFYNAAAAFSLPTYSSCQDCTEEVVLEVVDFFNPLSAPKDIMDIIGWGQE